MDLWLTESGFARKSFDRRTAVAARDGENDGSSGG